MEGSTSTTQVVIPRLRGQTRYHLLHLQKQHMPPELCDQPFVSAAFAVADEWHWNTVDDPIYPACLAQYRKRHETSQDPPAYKSAKKPGMEGGSVTLETTLPLATSLRPPITSTPDDNEIRDQVQDLSLIHI